MKNCNDCIFAKPIVTRSILENCYVCRKNPFKHKIKPLTGGCKKGSEFHVH